MSREHFAINSDIVGSGDAVMNTSRAGCCDDPGGGGWQRVAGCGNVRQEAL